MNGAAVLAVVATASTAALAAFLLAPPPRRLAGRVRPYTVSARVGLGRSVDVAALGPPTSSPGLVRRWLDQPLRWIVGRLAGRWDGSGDEALALRLHQAGLLREVRADDRVLEFHVREVLATIAGLGLGFGAGLAVDVASSTVVLLTGLGAVVGATRWRGRLDRAVTARRDRMRIELYTVNHLLAMNVRVGGGIVQAIRRVVDRGEGVLVGELGEILAAHASGVPLAEALDRAAATSLEPHVARTYRLLAAGASHGADLADGLLAHSEDLRDQRREALRRQATRRRAAMLVPTIAVLAPVMLLFIAAPLPSLIYGTLR